MHGDDIRERTYRPSAYQTYGRRNDYQQRHHGYKRQNLRQNEIIGAIDTHNFHRVYLLRDTHRADFRSNVRTHFARQNETQDGARELQQQRLSRQQTYRISR